VSWYPCSDCCQGVRWMCCPGIVLPAYLHGVFASSCPALNGLAVVFNPRDASTGVQLTNYFSMRGCDTPNPPTNHLLNAALRCETTPFADPPDWHWTLGPQDQIISGTSFSSVCHVFASPVVLVSSQCDPFQVVFQGHLKADASYTGGCAYDNSPWTLTITV